MRLESENLMRPETRVKSWETCWLVDARGWPNRASKFKVFCTWPQFLLTLYEVPSSFRVLATILRTDTRGGFVIRVRIDMRLATPGIWSNFTEETANSSWMLPTASHASCSTCLTVTGRKALIYTGNGQLFRPLRSSASHSTSSSIALIAPLFKAIRWPSSLLVDD